MPIFPLTHGHRGSYGHGVPPQIAKNQYDVPLPSLDVLLPPSQRTVERIRAAHCHIAFCQLTLILGDLLPLVYRLDPRMPRETSKTIKQVKADLDVWEDSLPGWLRHPVSSSAPSRIAGSCSLRLSFLALKMLVNRVELKAWSSLP